MSDFSSDTVNLQKQLEQGIANAKAFGGRTGQRAENVLSDMLRFFKKKKRLTDGQRRYASVLMEQVSPETLRKRQEENQAWVEELRADKALQADIIAVAYYYLGAGYYTNTAKNCIAWHKNEIRSQVVRDRMKELGQYQAVTLPPKVSVMKMMNNPYAEKVKNSAKSKPLWSVGQLVSCRSTASGRFHVVSGDGQYWNNEGDGVYTIIEVDSRDIDKAITYKPKQGGARYYRLLMLGSTRVIDVMECDLKKVKKKLLK
tara:strand:+ start:151 stop:924 length:774 start_codon:yes stop_codon:yes gene_type:complete